MANAMRRLASFVIALFLMLWGLAAIPHAATASVGAGSYVVTYQTGPPRRDLIVTVPSVGVHPAVLVVHGGGWTGGSVTNTAALSTKLANGNDWVTINVEYRLTLNGTTDTLPIAQQKDVLAAVTWAHVNADTYGIDPARIAILGESAGANRALMAASAGAHVVAAVGWSAPTDLNTLWNATYPPGVRTNIQNYLGCQPPTCPDTAANASPITSIAAGQPPVWLSYGATDSIPSSQGTAFASAAGQVGNSAQVFVIPGVNCHALNCQPWVYAPTVSFLQSVFNASPPSSTTTLPAMTTAPETTTTILCGG